MAVRRAFPAGLVLLLAACSAPISTMRSPYHLRSVEIRNATSHAQTLAIEPTADQHLGASTTFVGLLEPGEVKVLYLYHGFDYQFRILDPKGVDELSRGIYEVNRDMGLVYAGDSIAVDTQLVVELGEPETTFADSLQDVDPFGLRSGGPIEPDTTTVPGGRDRVPPTTGRGQLP